MSEETLGQFLRRPPKGFFVTVHVKGQAEGEIEPSFYEEFRGELGKIWLLCDRWGLQHRVKLNDDEQRPKITNGWMFLRELYNFNDHHEILFKYIGRNIFQIFPTFQKTDPANFPTWHTLSRGLRKAVNFEMTITEDPEVNPFVTLPTKMGQYLANAMLDEVWLIGTICEKHQCVLDYQFDPLVVRIKKGWPEVVGINGFQVGDRLVFNICSIYETHLIYVRKLN